MATNTPKSAQIERDDEWRLRWIIGISSSDLSHLRPGDALNMAEDLEAFLHGGEPRVISDDAPLMRRLLGVTDSQAIGEGVLAAVGEAQRGAQRLLNYYNLTLSKTAKYPDQPMTGPTITVRWSLYPAGLTSKRKPRVMANVEGGLAQAILLRTLLLLAGREATRLRACPECRTPFLRVRRQVYCGSRCTARVNMRAWLDTPKGKAHLKRQAKRSASARARERREHTTKKGGKT